MNWVLMTRWKNCEKKWQRFQHTCPSFNLFYFISLHFLRIWRIFFWLIEQFDGCSVKGYLYLQHAFKIGQINLYVYVHYHFWHLKELLEQIFYPMTRRDDIEDQSLIAKNLFYRNLNYFSSPREIMKKCSRNFINEN